MIKDFFLYIHVFQNPVQRWKILFQRKVWEYTTLPNSLYVIMQHLIFMSCFLNNTRHFLLFHIVLTLHIPWYFSRILFEAYLPLLSKKHHVRGCVIRNHFKRNMLWLDQTALMHNAIKIRISCKRNQIIVLFL